MTPCTCPSVVGYAALGALAMLVVVALAWAIASHVAMRDIDAASKRREDERARRPS